MNLFTQFNPDSSWLSLYWLFLLIPVILFMPDPLFLVASRFYILLSRFQVTILSFFIPKTKSLLVSLWLTISMFLCIMLLNWWSLLPFTPSITAMFNLNFALALVAWMMISIYGWLNSADKSFSMLVPEDCPNFLAPSSVLIELVSLLIRPITLSVRLSANLVAGHLLISLLSEFINSKSMIMLPLLSVLLFLEISVSVIQAYIFTLLVTMYFQDL